MERTESRPSSGSLDGWEDLGERGRAPQAPSTPAARPAATYTTPAKPVEPDTETAATQTEEHKRSKPYHFEGLFHHLEGDAPKEFQGFVNRFGGQSWVLLAASLSLFVQNIFAQLYNGLMESKLPSVAKLGGSVALAGVNLYIGFQTMMFEVAKRIVLAIIVTPLYLSSATREYAEMAWSSVGLTVIGGTAGALNLSWKMLTQKKDNLFALNATANTSVARVVRDAFSGK